MSLVAADVAGAPVVSVGSLVLRPVAAGQLEGPGGGLRDLLFSVEWVPVPVPGGGTAAGRWAVIGADRLGLAAGLAGAGLDAGGYADLAALADAVGAGEAVPEVVLAGAGAVAQVAGEDRPDRSDMAEMARRAAGRVLGLVQGWLAEERLASSRLVLVMRGAVAAGAGEGVADLPGAAVWGLVRSAQSEHPGRLVLADLPGADLAGTLAVLAAALGSGEPELAVRDRIAYGRRLARPAGRLVPAGGGLSRGPGTVLVTGGRGRWAPWWPGTWPPPAGRRAWCWPPGQDRRQLASRTSPRGWLPRGPASGWRAVMWRTGPRWPGCWPVSRAAAR